MRKLDTNATALIDASFISWQACHFMLINVGDSLSLLEYGQHHHSVVIHSSRALCRIKLLPVTHVLVDTWMLTVKPVYKLLNVSDDLKWTTNTHVTPFSLTFKA